MQINIYTRRHIHSVIQHLMSFLGLMVSYFVSCVAELNNDLDNILGGVTDSAECAGTREALCKCELCI